MAYLTHFLNTTLERLAKVGGLYVTERQLYYELCRTLYPTPGLASQQLFRGLAVAMIPPLLALPSPRRAAKLAVADSLLVAALWGVRHMPFTRSAPISYERFQATLREECTRNGRPLALLPPVAPLRLPLSGREPDLADYGLAHLLVCQQAEVAQMLLANDFHLTMGCAVLSLEEANPLPDTLVAMLERTSEAQVYLLHDASPEGLALVRRFAERLALPEGVRLMALGLRPIHALKLHLFAERRPFRQDEHNWPSYLSARERSWLEKGYCAEVQAVPPVRLLRVLRRIMLGRQPTKFNLPNLRHERVLGFMTWPKT